MALRDEAEDLSETLKELRKPLDEFRKGVEEAGRTAKQAAAQPGAVAGAAGGAAVSALTFGMSGPTTGILGTINIVTEAAQTVSALAQKAEGLPDFIKEALGGVGDLANGVQNQMRTLQVQNQASSAVTGQLSSFALAGIEIPRETIDRMAGIEVARAQKIVELDNQVRNVTRARVVADKAQQMADLLGGGG